MQLSRLVIAAFLALASTVTAAPIDARGQYAKPVVVDPSIAVLSNNDNNGFVAFSGNGGAGGTNVALPVAISSAKGSNKGKDGKVLTGSLAGNVIQQSANGGDGSAVGSYGSHNSFYKRDEFEERDYKKSPQPVAILSGNDNNGVVIGSGNGGNGGLNIAKPVAISSSKGFNKGKDGWVVVGSASGNVVSQDANGGNGNAVGTFGEGNWFGRDVEERTTTYSYPPSKQFGSNNNNNGVVIGSGNGGNGGTNLAKPIAISSAKGSNDNKWGVGTVFSGSAAGNIVQQEAYGGDGSAVGTFGSGNHISKRGYMPPKYSSSILSNNDNNGVVIGSGNGGNGGINIAKPIASSQATGSNSGDWSKVLVGSAAGNVVQQQANGGDGFAVGTFGEGNHIKF